MTVPEHAPSLETLFEAADLPGWGLQEPLRRIYGGDLGFDRPVLYANFVSSLDGVVSLGQDVLPSVISGGARADRMVMALLRTCADSVVVGASTVRAEPTGLWTADYVCPELGDELRSVREALGLSEAPRLVILTRSGELDPLIRALRHDALVFTTERGAERLRGRVPAGCEVEALGTDAVPPGGVVGALRARGDRSILCEGGPTVLGEFLSGQLVDELFLTLAPTIAGRAEGSARLALVEGFAYPPERLARVTLRSAKRHGSLLFLRYGLRAAGIHTTSINDERRGMAHQPSSA